jgi:hypothetical protein
VLAGFRRVQPAAGRAVAEHVPDRRWRPRAIVRPWAGTASRSMPALFDAGVGTVWPRRLTDPSTDAGWL